ncbi:24061_t:CDS:2, partial [Racocetra persica]
VHMALNNLDKLRHLVSKVQKEHNPYRQDILGIFADRQIIVICISKLQTKAWKSLECFEIDIAFKHIQENINELEINSYNEYYKI